MFSAVQVPTTKALIFRWLTGMCLLLLALAAPAQADIEEDKAKAKAEAAPLVAVSIRPWYLLAREIGADDIQVELLLNGASSPHTGGLKPSSRKLIANADLLVWTGEDLELSLAPVVKTLAASRLLTLEDDVGMSYPSVAGMSHGLDHQRDPHLWLNPHNARRAVEAMALRFGQLLPSQRFVFMQRAKALIGRIATLEGELDSQLQSVAQQRFYIFHDALAHLRERFPLNQAGIITANPELSPGARHLNELLEGGRNSGVACVFGERNHPAPVAERLAEQLPAKLKWLDTTAAAGESYELWLRSLVADINACLLPKNPA